VTRAQAGTGAAGEATTRVTRAQAGADAAGGVTTPGARRAA